MDDRPSLERFEPGIRLAGKYRLERLLGRGGMGVVYAATNLLLEVRVAIKLVRPDVAEDPLVVARLLEEARCAAQITPRRRRVSLQRLTVARDSVARPCATPAPGPLHNSRLFDGSRAGTRLAESRA
jgi:serine/threonine protein kinase